MTPERTFLLIIILTRTPGEDLTVVVVAVVMFKKLFPAEYTSVAMMGLRNFAWVYLRVYSDFYFNVNRSLLMDFLNYMEGGGNNYTSITISTPPHVTLLNQLNRIILFVPYILLHNWYL